MFRNLKFAACGIGYAFESIGALHLGKVLAHRFVFYDVKK